MGGGTSLSSHRAGFGVFWSEAISKSAAQSAFAGSENCNDNAITTSNAAHSPRNDKGYNPLPLGSKANQRGTSCVSLFPKRSGGEGGTQCRVRVKKAAFTLAEVLITLAIIGIVAALTIPTLIQNFQQDAWDTASEVFQRKLEESLKVMNVQGTLAGYTTTEAFVDELSKHIKITRICDNDDITTCFADKVTWGTENEEVEMADVKRASHFGQDSWGTNTVGVQFANGVNAVLAYNPECVQNQFSNQITGTSCLAILYDVDGFKNPNTQNKDLRSINVSSLGGSSCSFEVDGICFGTPFQPTALTAADCNANKDKYGIQTCRTTDDDFWGGAMKTCAEQGKRLPNDSELTTLANDLYGQDVSAGDGEPVENITMNTDKASSYGIPINDFSDGINGFYLWSGQETDASDAHGRAFASVYTLWFSNGVDRNDYAPYLLAVCVGE